MNIDQQIKKIQNEDAGNIDLKNFINNLHRKRAQNDVRISRIVNGIMSLSILAFFSFITVSQLAYEPGTFTSTDLIPYFEMDADTESYVIDLAAYLIDSSNDIWETLNFFEEINFDNLIASNYGDINE